MLQRYMHKVHLYPCQPARVSDDDHRCSCSGSLQCLTDGALFDDGLSIIFTATIGG